MYITPEHIVTGSRIDAYIYIYNIMCVRAAAQRMGRGKKKAKLYLFTKSTRP